MNLARHKVALGAVALGASLSTAPGTASACSAPICLPATLLPQASGASPALVPASAAFVRVLRASVDGESASTLTLSRTRAGATTTETLVVVDGLAEIPDAQDGDLLAITESHPCSRVEGSTQTSSTSIRITASAALPAALGAVDVGTPSRREISVSDASGPCTSPIDSVASTYSLELDPATTAWSDALELRVLVDGVVWSEPRLFPPTYPPRVDPGLFVFAACEAPTPGQAVSDLDEGEHTIRIEATVRGTSTTLTTEDETFSLECAPPASSGASGGTCRAVPGRGRAGASGLALMLAALVLRVRRRHPARP